MKISKQMIIEIAEDTNLSTLPKRLKRAIKEGGISWPDQKMAGTATVDGKRLILIISKIKKSKLESWISSGFPYRSTRYNNTVIRGKPKVDLGIDWRILAVEGRNINMDEITPYLQGDPILDENNDVTGYKPVLNPEKSLQTFSGKKWVFQ